MAKMLNSKLQGDLEALFEHVFEHETEDFFESICNEEYFVDEEILTEEECEEMADAIEDQSDRMYEISEKAAMNPNCMHVYAVAYRLYMDFSLNYRDKKGKK